MSCTDLNQPINRREAVAITDRVNAIREELTKLIRRAQGNGHDDAPDFMDEALTSLGNAVESIGHELDSARERAA